MKKMLSFVVVLSALVGCAAPLAQLGQSLEKVPVYQWGYIPPSSESLQDTYQRLQRIALILGIPIEMGTPETVAGLWNPSDRTIRIQGGMTLDGQVQVVAHELAHALQPMGLSTEAERELFADAVSYLVVLPEHNDLARYAKYLGRFRLIGRAFIKAYEREIQWAAMVLRMEIR